MILTKKSGGDFQPHPETDALIKGVIVDITPLKKRDTAFGPKEEFRLVIETELKKDDGSNWHVWSRGYTPSLNEKAAFRKDLKKILGRALTPAEEDGFDVEKQLLHFPVMVLVGHDVDEKDSTKVYANIRHISPDKSGDPLKPSGKYVRVQDREKKGDGSGSSASYRKAGGGDEEEGRVPWQKCKVHVGKNAGLDLGDLDEESVKGLIEKWLPKAKAGEPTKDNPTGKVTADDKRLIAALEAVQALLATRTSAEKTAEAPY